ncbi:helix-turn-helix domain-containing protein [bacterium]|nr:helix-turn-helix domain-containing protein [bacterium]
MDSSKSTSAIADFCSELREARRFKKITFEEVVRRTCITQEYLQALEEGEWERIPAAYLRGYLALYAVTVGMNREKVLRTYDAIVESRDRSTQAVLDDSPPAIKRPEHRSITRAKIRTGWYAQLARHPVTFRVVTITLIVLGLGLLYFMRYSGSRPPKPADFKTVLRELEASSDSQAFGPPPPPDEIGEGEETEFWVQWIGLSEGTLSVQCDEDTVLTFQFTASDTIVTPFQNQLAGWILPSESASFLLSSGSALIVEESRGDTLILAISVECETKPDSLAVVD